MRRTMVRLILASVALTIIIVRFHHVPKDDLELSVFSDKGQLKISGIIIDDPEMRTKGQRFTFAAQVVDGQNLSEKSEHKLLMQTEHSDLRYGDQLLVSASVKKPEVIEGEDGRDFDYPGFLSKDGIFYLADARQVEVIKRDQGHPLVSTLFKIKHAFINNLEDALPAPHSFLAGGLVISGKGSLDKDLQEQFQKAGLIHIVVLSGFNISIIGEAIIRALSFMPLGLRSVFGGLSIIMFSIMTGGGATVVRSAIMSIIALYARFSGRQNSAAVSLVFAGMLMLIHNPRLAIHDPSFQLSFAATLGLILYAEPIERLLAKPARLVRLPAGVLSLVSSTLATQIFTLPLIMRFSGLVSLIALPVNILVLPLIPLTMLFVFFTGVLGFIIPSAAMFPAFVSWILLSYELMAVKLASGLSWSAITLNPIALRSVFIGYSLLFAIALMIKRRGGGGGAGRLFDSRKSGKSCADLM